MAESKDTTPYDIKTDPDADAKINFLAGYVNDPKNKTDLTQTDLTQTDPKSKKTNTSNGGKRKSRRNRKSRQNRKKKSRQSRRH